MHVQILIVIDERGKTEVISNSLTSVYPIEIILKSDKISLQCILLSISDIKSLLYVFKGWTNSCKTVNALYEF